MPSMGEWLPGVGGQRPIGSTLETDAAGDLEKKPKPDVAASYEVTTESVEGRTVTQQGRRSNLAHVFGLAQADDADIAKASLLASLQIGKPLGFEAARMVRELTGVSITRDGLAQLYEGCLPGTKVFVEAKSAYSSFEYSINWIDSDGVTVARINRRMGKDQDGALELYSHGCWTDSTHRDRALSAKVMAQETEMLRALSSNPKTRLSLWAGGMKDPNNPENFQPIGVYVWANMGFDAAQNHGLRSKLPMGGAFRDRCVEDKDAFRQYTDFSLAKHVFRSWLKEMVDKGHIPDRPEITAMLEVATREWTSMWHISTFKVDGLSIPVELGGRKLACDIGKAFMLSGRAPRWEGVFFVNQRESSAHAVADLYSRSKIAQADTDLSKQIERWLADMASPERQVHAPAILALGKSGDLDLVPTLEAAKDGHASPELIQDAIDRLLGKKLMTGLANRSKDRGVRMEERIDAFEKYLELSNGPTFGFLRSFIDDAVDGADLRLAREAVRCLIATEGHARPEVVADLMMALYQKAKAAPDDAGGDPIRKAPSLDGFGDLSPFQQRVKTRELVVEEIAKVGAPGVTEFLESVVKNDPYWEIAASACAAHLRATAHRDPGKAHDLAADFLDRCQRRHVEAKAQGKQELMTRLSTARERVLKACSVVPDPRMTSLLIRITETDPYWEPRREALDALASQTGDTARVVRAAQALYDIAGNSAQTRGRCIKVLGNLPGGAGLPKLAELIARETDEWGLRDSLFFLQRAPDRYADAIAKVKAKLLDIDARKPKYVQQDWQQRR